MFAAAAADRRGRLAGAIRADGVVVTAAEARSGSSRQAGATKAGGGIVMAQQVGTNEYRDEVPLSPEMRSHASFGERGSTNRIRKRTAYSWRGSVGI